MNKKLLNKLKLIKTIPMASLISVIGTLTPAQLRNIQVVLNTILKGVVENKNTKKIKLSELRKIIREDIRRYYAKDSSSKN